MSGIALKDVLAELVEEGRSESAIITGMGMTGYKVFIVCVMRPTDEGAGWMIYNEDLTLVHMAELKKGNELLRDMNKRDAHKRYYWANFYSGNLNILTEIPCDQDRDW